MFDDDGYIPDRDKTQSHLENAERWYMERILRYQRRLAQVRQELKRRKKACCHCGCPKKGRCDA